MPAVTANTRLRLRVKATAETIVRGGHPWVFADSLRDQNREGQTGELAVIYDRNDKFLAVGLFDADSPIRVRILHAGKPQTIDAAWWQARLSQTRARRAGLFDAQTTGYRLIHGESDGWPGLVLDRYDTTLALKLYTAAWLPRMDETLALIKAQIPSERIVLRLSRNLQAAAAKDFQQHDGQILFGAPPEGAVIFCENGVRFEADVIRGQKTGFFLDQRENRREVETLAAGRRVLNAFSFSGGFSVYAARGGAKSVTDLDISAHALESAKRNFALNRNFPAVAACRQETVQADAFDWIEKAPAKFDLIVLDPPSLAKRASESEGAVRAYERLNSLGINL
ncbi:MAG: class I SAM-dependent methyltransferase, partial [Verrucomicrobiota bacterium]